MAPFSIAWQEGSDQVPDFLMTTKDLVVTERVKTAFGMHAFSGYTPWLALVQDHVRKGRAAFPIVESPYRGPTLWDMYVDLHQMVRLVPNQSTIEFAGKCQQCGAEQWSVPEELSRDEQFFTVDRRTWHGQDFMLPLEVNNLFVTQRVAEVIAENSFTNVVVRRIGRISE